MSTLTRDMTTLASAVGALKAVCVTPDGAALFAASNVAGRIVGYNLTPGATSPLTANFFGTGTAGTVDGPAGTATVNAPAFTQTDGTYVWFYQQATFTIRRGKISDKSISTVAGTGVTGSVDGVGTAASIGIVSSMFLHLPTRTIWFSEGTKLRTMNIDTGAIATIPVTLEGPSTGICLNAAGTVVYGWYLNRARLWRMPTSGGFITYYAGNGSSATDVDGSGPAASLRDVSQMELDSAGGILYISQIAGLRVRQVNLATGAVSTVVGNGVSASVNGNGTSAQIAGAYGLAIWPGKSVTTLIVTDYNGGFLKQVL